MLFFTAAILLCALRDAQCKTRESRVFPSHFALFPCLFTLGLYNGHSINALAFFAALAEVHVRRYFGETSLILAAISEEKRLPFAGYTLPPTTRKLNKSSTVRISSHFSNRALLCLQPAVICLRVAAAFVAGAKRGREGGREKSAKVGEREGS